MVGRRLDLLARGQAEPVHRLHTRREHVGQVATHVLQPLVQRPDGHVLGIEREQLAHRRLCTGVRAQDAGVLGEAAGLTQVGHRRLLVLPLLRTTVQLRQRDDRDADLLREELERTGELGDLLLSRLDLLARRHELQVVDDDELEVVLLLEPPALGADLGERHVRRVVDEHRRLGNAAHHLGDLLPVVLAHGAVAQLLQVDARLRGEQTHRDLVAAHLEREDDGRLPVLDRRRPRDVDGERRVVRRDHCPAREVEV